MDFLNKPMSEVWRATKRTFNEIMEINNTDLNQASGSRTEFDFAVETSHTNTPTAVSARASTSSSTGRRYTYSSKAASLPRLQKLPKPVDFREYHILDSTDNRAGESGRGAEGHASRSRTTTPSEEDDQSNFQPRNRYRSNSSDRASMRIRNDVDSRGSMVNRYQRSTSYDKAMDNSADDEDEEEEEDASDKMKSKLMSMWNNMKYGWTVKSKTAFSLQKPIWFLGKCYQHRPSDPEPVLHPGMETVKSPQTELFKQDFTSRLWMTYRRDFPALDGTTLTTDCGWGCMLRSGQMIMAQCLAAHFLGREWNIYKEQTDEQSKFHHEIIRWFGDQPSDMSPFSIHRLVNLGLKTGKKAGDWYGPASIAHIMRDAMETAPELNPLFEQVAVYVAQDCTVYKQDVIDLCRNRYQGSPKPTYKDKPGSPKPMNKAKPTNKDKPAPTSTAHAQTNSQNAPIQNGQQPSKIYCHETPINGDNSDKRRGASTTLRNASYYESVYNGQIESELTVSHNAVPKKQTTFSHVDNSDRTVVHSTFGNSSSNERLCANTSSQTSNCQESSDSSTISHNASQFAKCPPIPPHNVSKYGTNQSSLNASGFANCPPIPPHGVGFGHGTRIHNATGPKSPSHNAPGHLQTVSHGLSGYGHGTPTHNASEHTAIKPSQSAPGLVINPSSHNPTAHSKSLPPHHASGNVLSPNSQECKRRTKSETDDGGVCQIRDDTGEVCRIKENTEHFIYRRNAVRETKQTSASKSPTRDNRTWREYRNPSGGQRSQSQSSVDSTTNVHEPIWRRKSEDFRSSTLGSGMPSQSPPHRDRQMSLVTGRRSHKSKAKHSSPYDAGVRPQSSKHSQSSPHVAGMKTPKSKDLQSQNPVTGTMSQKSKDLQATTLVTGMLTQNSKETEINGKETEINGVCLDAETQPNVREEAKKEEPVVQNVDSSSSHNAIGHSATQNAPEPPPHASEQSATHNAVGFSAAHNAPEPPPHDACGQSATHNAFEHSATHNACEQSATHNAPEIPPHNAPGHFATQNATRQSKKAEENIESDNSGTETEKEEKKWCALILLVPVRLGGDEVNPIYINPLRSLFTLESCMGIIGGKPKHSVYYVGFQDEKLIHLDPHYCQNVVDMKNRKFSTYSFHCMSPRKMRITNMDPSCTVGFYLKTEEDFEEFCQMIHEVVTPAQSSGDYPMFIVRDGHCNDWQDNTSIDSDTKKDRFLRIRHIDQDGRLLAPMKESEDFVFLES